QRERAAPGAAEQLPAIDLQVLAQLLEVRHQVPGGVLLEARVRRAAPATALIEQDDAIDGGIEEPPLFRVGAAARAAVDEHHGFALRIARLLEIDVVQRGHREHPALERFDRRKETAS